MKHAWFKRVGWLHLPISVPGAVVSLVAASFCINVFFAIDRHSHSVSDTLYGVFLFFAARFYLWIGLREALADYRVPDISDVPK